MTGIGIVQSELDLTQIDTAELKIRLKRDDDVIVEKMRDTH